jgi:formate-dependent nitrite reductase membrane component NrfD
MGMPANVFSEDYRIAFKTQQVWGVPHAIEFFLLGAAAGLYLFSTWSAPAIVGQLTAVVLILGAGAALVLDLGQPARLWRSLANLRKSWISRGALSVFLFLATALVAIGARQSLSTAVGANLALSCEIAASLFALVAMLYPGLVLSSYASIPAWNSPMVPLLFFIYSWTTGLAILWLVQLLAGIEQTLAPSPEIGIFVLALTILSLLTHLGSMSRGSVAVRESFRQLTRGSLAGLFLGVVLGVGLVVPLLILLSATFANAADAALIFLASLAIAIGGFFFRYCVLKAGLYPPLF